MATPPGPFSGLEDMVRRITLDVQDVCTARDECVSVLTLLDRIPPVGYCQSSVNPAGKFPGQGNQNGNGNKNKGNGPGFSL